MANKTMKFYGIGYNPAGGSASITATYNGGTVFSGTIPTLPTSEPVITPTDYEVLFTHEIDENFIGTVPVSMTLNSGDGFTIGRVEINSTANVQIFRPIDLDPETNSGDCRTNVKINGVTQEKGPLGDVLTGAWSWHVFEGGTITYDLAILDPFATGNVTP